MWSKAITTHLLGMRENSFGCVLCAPITAIVLFMSMHAVFSIYLLFV